MIIVRNVFQLSFGKAREALALAKQNVEMSRKAGLQQDRMRLLTDVVGRFYTLVLEITFSDLAEMERTQSQMMGIPEWRAWYDKMVPLVESGYREIFRVVE
jgi:hypothetical protein